MFIFKFDNYFLLMFIALGKVPPFRKNLNVGKCSMQIYCHQAREEI